MKKSFLKSLTILLVLSMAMTILVLPSCSSTSSMPIMQQSDTISNIQKNAKVDTFLLRDSVYRHDSVIYRERTVHDTVYITKEVYRESQLSTLNSQLSTQSDTVVVTEYRDRVIEHPPEKYVPKFYKWCTGLFLAIGLLAIGYWLLKWWLKCRV